MLTFSRFISDHLPRPTRPWHGSTLLTVPLYALAFLWVGLIGGLCWVLDWWEAKRGRWYA